MRILILISLLMISYNTTALSMVDDPRYGGVVLRNTKGEIRRDMNELRRFQQIHPCPSTGLTTGPCAGWAIDHVISLACGGIDRVVNMQWLPLTIKSCKNDWCKDRFERDIQYVQGPVPGMISSSCTPKIMPSWITPVTK